MQPEVGHPWFHRAAARLALRRRDRVLAIDPTVDEVLALRSMVGDQGEMTLLLRDDEAAEQLAEHDWPQVRVLAHTVDGGETFGTFDALLVAPTTGPLLPCEGYAELSRNNLRPGGRFVIDLPGPDMLPDVRAAWLTLGRDEEQLRLLSGPSDVELAEALRAAGLRNVEAALASHLLHAASPADLVAPFGDVLGLDDDDANDLARAIVSDRKDPGPLDALVHRTQVGGLR